MFGEPCHEIPSTFLKMKILKEDMPATKHEDVEITSV